MINFPDPNAVVTNWLQYSKSGTYGCTASRCCPDRDVCVDEQLVPFKGRCGFKQYVPKKPAKYGLKVWALCDVKMSYAWKVQVYTGKGQPGDEGGPGDDRWAPGTHLRLHKDAHPGVLRPPTQNKHPPAGHKAPDFIHNQ